MLGDGAYRLEIQDGGVILGTWKVASLNGFLMRSPSNKFVSGKFTGVK